MTNTKKDDDKQTVVNNEENDETNVIRDEEIDDNFLQDELNELQKAEDEAKNEWKADFAPLLNKIKELEGQLQEKDEIAKNSQINYLHLKADFDILQRQTQQKIENVERDSTIKVVKDFLPFIENLRKSLLNLTDEQKESWLGAWLQMMYDGFIKSLEKLHIKPIEAIGLEPNPQFHEPVSMQTVENEWLKWKIIQEFQQGFVYEVNDDLIVVSPSRVIVWN